MTPSTQYIRASEAGFQQETLDALLSVGYYRMQHFMFTCNETPTSEDMSYTIPVFWLRTLANKISFSKSANAILNKNKSLKIIVKPAEVNEEVEELYSIYRNHKPFSTSETCYSYLHTTELPNPFDSWMIEVRQRNELVAVGYFDRGQNSIAGIMNIYHPAFEKYSLGKLLMLQKIKFAQQHQIQFYYTGYISTGSTRFDYKTFPDANATEVYLPKENKWANFALLGKDFLQDYYIKFLV
jgi:arginine-tRNA-protein transferase